MARLTVEVGSFAAVAAVMGALLDSPFIAIKRIKNRFKDGCVHACMPLLCFAAREAPRNDAPNTLIFPGAILGIG
jgi:hypothetical protein